MNLLFWLDIGFDRHGPSVHLLKAMIEESLKAGHEVSVILRNTGGNEPNIPEAWKDQHRLHVEIIRDQEQEKGAFVKRYLDDVLYFFRSESCLRKHPEADAVFLQSCYLPLVPIWMIHRQKKPVLFNVQNIFPIDAGVLGLLPTRGVKGIPYRILRWLQQLAYKKADCVVTISEDMRKTLLGEKCAPERLKVVYNWSYGDDAAMIPEEENLFLRDHPEFIGKYRVVFAGNMGAMVAPQTIADAAELLQQESEIVFIIIGAGNNMPKLKDMAQDKGLSNIFFFPYQPEEYARHNYAMAHVNINALPQGIIGTCMPSKTATMLNAAKPMVVAAETDSDYARILREVDKCTVVNWDDARGFAQAILTKYRGTDREDSANAREIFRKYCSCENAKSYVMYMEETASRGKKN